MRYNLTDNQKNLLRGIIADIREEKLPEEFIVVWSVDGAVVTFEKAQGFLSFSGITKSRLNALSSENLISCIHQPEIHHSNVSINQSAFDAVDNNFMSVAVPVEPLKFEPTLFNIWKISDWQGRAGLISLFGFVFFFGFGVAQIPQLSAIVQTIKNLL